jgi:hypothetical protein
MKRLQLMQNCIHSLSLYSSSSSHSLLFLFFFLRFLKFLCFVKGDLNSLLLELFKERKK